MDPRVTDIAADVGVSPSERPTQAGETVGQQYTNTLAQDVFNAYQMELEAYPLAEGLADRIQELRKLSVPRMLRTDSYGIDQDPAYDVVYEAAKTRLEEGDTGPSEPQPVNSQLLRLVTMHALMTGRDLLNPLHGRIHDVEGDHHHQ